MSDRAVEKAGSAAGTVLLTLCAGQFLMALDSSVMNVSVGVSQQTADAVLDEYGRARVDGLRTALALLALFSVVALFFTRRVPTQQPGAVAAVGDSSPPGG